MFIVFIYCFNTSKLKIKSYTLIHYYIALLKFLYKECYCQMGEKILNDFKSINLF